MATVEERRHILFVDDDQAFLETLAPLFSSWSKGRWQVHSAGTSAHALALLQEYRMVLAVLDLQMPVVDGQQFLHLLNRKYPGLQKVVLTGFGTEECRAACLADGAELFLEKPRDPEEFESVFATLNELASWQPQEGFRGLLRQVGLQDVLQMECLGRNSSLLEVSTAEARGRIYIRNGSIIHAEAEESTGEAAFNLLLALRGGEFNLKPFEEPTRQTIEGQWEFLLMEAARMRDEAAPQPPENVESISEPAPTALPPVPPTPPALAPSSRSRSPSVPTPPPLRTVVPAATTSRASLGSPAVGGRQIDEVLVCSSQGEVLYEWQCAGMENRLKLFQIIAEKARRVNHALPLGRFERLEIVDPQGRIVAQIHPDRKLWVRSDRRRPRSEPFELRSVNS